MIELVITVLFVLFVLDNLDVLFAMLVWALLLCGVVWLVAGAFL